MLFPKWRQNPTHPILRYFSVVNLEKDNFTNFAYSWQINENSYIDNFFAVVIRKKEIYISEKKNTGVASTLKLKRILRWIIDYDKPRLIQWIVNSRRKPVFSGIWRYIVPEKRHIQGFLTRVTPGALVGHSHLRYWSTYAIIQYQRFTREYLMHAYEIASSGIRKACSLLLWLHGPEKMTEIVVVWNHACKTKFKNINNR